MRFITRDCLFPVHKPSCSSASSFLFENEDMSLFVLLTAELVALNSHGKCSAGKSSTVQLRPLLLL